MTPLADSERFSSPDHPEQAGCRPGNQEPELCGVGCAAGLHGEMLLCGFKEGHDGAHAWASLPTFVGGKIIADEQLGDLIRSLGLAHDVLSLMIDPDPEKGVLTAIHKQGVSDTYWQAVRVVEVLGVALEAAGATRS